MKIPFLFYFILCTSALAYSQTINRENYDIRTPGKAPDKPCKDFYTTLRAMPHDARFSAFVKGDSVIFTHSDADWFWQLIKGKNDGIAIDLVFKEQYACDNVHRFATSWSHKGFLLRPLYRDEIKKNLLPVREGYVAVYAGNVPKTWKKDNLEANYLILQDKNLCYYSNIISLDYHGWALLKNGLYYDTLNRQKLQEGYEDLSKTLHFTIPFEKDKWEYKEADIRPLYDSLKITDYAIRAIRINGYTSVEGTSARNQKLQNLRAESIVKALQSFQSEKLGSTILTSENWVEFLDDISGTPYNNLMALSKDEIKEKLRSPDLLNKLEPVLRKHRKAIIELDLEKRISYLKSSARELKKYFNQQLAARNIEEALQLQQIIFYKIDRHELPDNFLDEIEVPQALEYGGLLINNASYLYENGSGNVFEARSTFEKLDALLKNNPKIKYNLCALRLQSWLQSDLSIDPGGLKQEIESLRKMGIPDALVRRLQINYHIIMSEIQLRQKNYGEKDKAMKFIYDAYKPLHLKDDDLVNLAKYFSHNSKFEWAEQVLQPRTKSLDVSEDLLFYYLNLTIYDERNTKSNSYRAIMLNAINGNQNRYCKLFESIKNGGVTFQLLNDPYLKKTYCENCK